MPIQNVISTLSDDGKELVGPDVLLLNFPSPNITNATLLTVERSQFAVLKSRGAIHDVYETGQFQIQPREKPLFGSVHPAWQSGQTRWQYEVIYINRARLACAARGAAFSREMAELNYDVGFYVHVENQDAALKLVQQMPYRDHGIQTNDVSTYARPVVEQAVNQLCQVTPLEQINDRVNELADLVRLHLEGFLSECGLTLSSLKLLVRPADEHIRRLIALKAFGFTGEAAMRYHIAMEMAQRGIVSAPNMACGEAFHVGGPAAAQFSIAKPGENGAAAHA